MRRAVEGEGVSWMKNKKWYIVIKYWFDENDYRCRLNHWTILTNDKDYDKIKGESHIEEIDPNGDWSQTLKNRFYVASKDGWYKFVGNLKQCLNFIKKINKICDTQRWEDWEWSNGKYDAIDVEVDEDE